MYKHGILFFSVSVVMEAAKVYTLLGSNVIDTLARAQHTYCGTALEIAPEILRQTIIFFILFFSFLYPETVLFLS